MEGHTATDQVNMLGERLEACCTSPMTGWYRTGCCEVGGDDVGVHAVCAIMTDEFLEFSRSVGNDLSTPMPAHGFPGLKAGDQWCLCAPRWQEAHEAGRAPQVRLRATNILAAEFCDVDALRAHAIDL
ncbi:MAG: DUF2237 domain-containing protein [Actinobacteria bacterium]|nr:DUF2237 domain-containing protein [Actinomycetota bacterium]